MNKTSHSLDLVIFLTPPTKFVGGGIISIFSLAKESRIILKNTGIKVIVSTYPGYNSYRKNDLFENDEYIYSFDEIISEFSDKKEVLIHIPENDISMVSMKLPNYIEYLKGLKSLQFNILNQNIQLMPNEHTVAKLQWFTDNITQTTAHLRYATQELANKYNTPVHHLSVFIDPQNYKPINFTNKKNIIAISNDNSPYRKRVIEELSKLKNYKVVEVNNLTYNEYKNLISEAKFTLTFGEGFDGYYIESVFSKNIGIAVYNEDFFPSESYGELPNIYSSYENLISNIGRDIIAFDNESQFEYINELNFKKLNKLYSHNVYIQKLSNFYNKKFDFKPSKKAESYFIKASIEQGYQIEQEYELVAEKHEKTLRDIEKLKQKLQKKDIRIHELNTQIDDIYRSASWRSTSLLRKFFTVLKK